MEKSFLTLREIQLAELDILIQFDSFCSKYNLKYSLAYGTLLGAVRHRGFIPWDDDLDVTMPRPDYDRMLDLIDFLPAPLGVQSAYNSKLVTPFVKIVNKQIRMQEIDYEGIEDEYLWIDVFPLDGVIDPDGSGCRRLKTINRLLKSCRRMDLNYPYDSHFKQLLRTAYKLLKGKGRQFDKVGNKINELARCDDYASASLVMPFFDELKKPLVYRKEDVEKTIPMSFEGYELPVMSCWEYHLKNVYGDYMRIPNPDEQADHGASAWYI